MVIKGDYFFAIQDAAVGSQDSQPRSFAGSVVLYWDASRSRETTDKCMNFLRIFQEFYL